MLKLQTVRTSLLRLRKKSDQAPLYCGPPYESTTAEPITLSPRSSTSPESDSTSRNAPPSYDTETGRAQPVVTELSVPALPASRLPSYEEEEEHDVAVITSGESEQYYRQLRARAASGRGSESAPLPPVVPVIPAATATTAPSTGAVNGIDEASLPPIPPLPGYSTGGVAESYVIQVADNGAGEARPPPPTYQDVRSRGAGSNGPSSSTSSSSASSRRPRRRRNVFAPNRSDVDLTRAPVHATSSTDSTTPLVSTSPPTSSSTSTALPQPPLARNTMGGSLYEEEYNQRRGYTQRPSRPRAWMDNIQQQWRDITMDDDTLRREHPEIYNSKRYKFNRFARRAGIVGWVVVQGLLVAVVIVVACSVLIVL